MKMIFRINNLLAVVVAAVLMSVFSSCSTSDKVPEVVVEVESISLNASSLNLIVGGTDVLTATIAPSNATDKTVTWSSSKTGVATVADGVVTAVAVGTTTITAAASNGKKASCTVTVGTQAVAAEGITLNKNTLSLVVGGTETLTATITPSNATDRTVTWSSSQTAVATVVDGKVTAVAAGTTTLTAATSNGKTALCTVTVSAQTIEVEGIELDKNALSIMTGDSITLVAMITPSNATNQTVVWESDNVQVATVGSDGKVKAITTGSAKVTAKIGTFSALCEVTVTDLRIPATEVGLNKTTLSLEEGAEEKLEATVLPENATDVVVWSSEDEAVATVGSDGLVKAVGVGTTHITATAGDKSGICAVTVTAAEEIDVVTSITLNRTTTTLKTDDFETLQATVVTTDGSQPVVSWSSSNTNVVTVDADGTIDAVAVGEAVITATAGDKSATCTVTVVAETIVIESLKVTPSTSEIVVDDALQLTVQTTPSNYTSGTISWYSREPIKASVDISTGLVHALSAGTVVILAMVDEDTTIKDSCVITIKEKHVPVTALNLSDMEITLTENAKKQLTAVIVPADATVQTVTWSSLDETVATVDETGNVTAVSEGITSIVARAESEQEACRVTVEPQSGTSIDFGDPNFENYLISLGLDTDNNGKLSTAEVKNVEKLECYSRGITSLIGIEHFEALKVLNCNDNYISHLDLSHNTLLKELNCRNSNVSSLDVSALTSLEILNCSENFLTSLEVENNFLLRELYCSENQLSSLNVNNNVELWRLNCSRNSLTSIDVNANSKLTFFSCSENSIGFLDVSNNTALNSLSCSGCDLTNLMLDNHPKLTFLDCSNNHLIALNISENNKMLHSLDCSHNQITGMLDLSFLDIMDEMDCSHNQIEGIYVSAALDALRETIKKFLYNDNIGSDAPDFVKIK